MYPDNDSRHRLDRPRMSEKIEEEGPPGPKCFGPRIMREPPVANFQLPRGVRLYNSSMNPANWLSDYVTACYVAGGNRRWAIRYIPQMLEGPARNWLDDLEEGSVNCYLDFHDQFIANFQSTYQRPNGSQQLCDCKQRENESVRDFLTRWSTVKNSCEGVQESRAVQ